MFLKLFFRRTGIVKKKIDIDTNTLTSIPVPEQYFFSMPILWNQFDQDYIVQIITHIMCS